MAANTATSEHPVFMGLITILAPIDHAPNPEDWEFIKCPATAVSTKSRCKINMSDRGKAETLYNQIKSMEKWPRTDEELDRIKDFLTASHCRHHNRAAVKRLEDWVASSAGTAPSTIDQVSVVSDEDRDDGSDISDITREPSIARSYDGQDDFPTPPSTAPATQPEDPMLLVTTKPEPAPASISEPSAPLENVTDGMSAMDINTAPEPKDTTTQTEANGVSVQRIIGLGLTKLERKGSLSDPTQVFGEIFKHLTPKQQTHGVVYIRESELEKDLFMISWTGQGEDKLNERKTCDALNSKIIYTSPGGSFFAAPKAGKLIQTVLRHHNLTVEKCDHCQGGHRNWFRAPRRMVLETAEIMENFVRLPAYESLDNENWKLSTIAREKIRVMCEFSPERLRDAIGEAEKTTAENEGDEDPSLQQTQGSLPDAETLDIKSSSQSSNPSDPSEASDSTKDNKDQRFSGGAFYGKKARSFTRGFEKAKARLSDGMNQFRKKGQEASSRKHERDEAGGKDAHEAVAGIFISLMPEEARNGEEQIKNKETRPGTSWLTTKVQQFANFLSEFEEEWKREDEANKEAKKPKDHNVSEESNEPRRSTRSSARNNED